nr:hypothetical protein [Tanacetum cinerariifolium]
MVVLITNQGYYWPSMHRDTTKVIQDCKKCKEQFAIRKAAKKDAIIAGNEWPFSHWRVNILGPLPTAPGAENVVTKDDNGRTKEVTKRKESKEVASIEDAYYKNKLRMYHDERSSHSTYKIGGFLFLS